MALDMFSYSYRVPGQLAPVGGQGYFSVDDGATAFMGGELNGWHWRDNDPACVTQPGIMVANYCSNLPSTVTGLDIAALDAIGWNTNISVEEYSRTTADMYRALTGTPAAVPEPTAWSLMIAGFGLLGQVLRRRRLARIA